MMFPDANFTVSCCNLQHFHTAAKMTPFMALYGYHPPSITSYLRENYKVQAVEDCIDHQQKVLQLLNDNLNFAQN